MYRFFFMFSLLPVYKYFYFIKLLLHFNFRFHKLKCKLDPGQSVGSGCSQKPQLRNPG